MILNSDDKVLVTHRKMFENDISRFFTGSVDEYQDGLVKVSGYSWQHDLIHGCMVKNTDRRTKIISLSSGMFIFYQLPDYVDVESLQLNFEKHGYMLKGNNDFVMDLSERLLKG